MLFCLLKDQHTFFFITELLFGSNSDRSNLEKEGQLIQKS